MISMSQHSTESEEEEEKLDNVVLAQEPVAEAIEQRDKMEELLQKETVLKGLSSMNVDLWISAIKAKLVMIRIASVKGVMMSSGKLQSYEDCGIAKSHQCKMSKTTELHSKVPGEHLMIDTSSTSVKKDSFGKVLKKKSDQGEYLVTLLKDLKR
jgi:hypothetical protein